MRKVYSPMLCIRSMLITDEGTEITAKRQASLML